MNMHARFPTAKGIPFSDMLAPLVFAGTKTMTRRVVRPQPDHFHRDIVGKAKPYTPEDWSRLLPQSGDKQVGCPYGKPGDILYVRETHYVRGYWIETLDDHRTGWQFVPESLGTVLFEPPKTFRISRDKENPGHVQWYKRLGRFMPKAYARTYLEVVSERVERLQEISEADAIAEGVEPNCAMRDHSNCTDHDGTYIKYGGMEDDFPAFTARESFQSLWEFINGEGAWDARPWVWVVEFKRVMP